MSAFAFFPPAALLAFFVAGPGDERLTLENVEAPPEITSKEALSGTLSLEKAARYLDQASLHWQKTKKCGTCHTNFAYLMARPALAGVRAPAPEVRSFFEEMVSERWEKSGPRWDAEVVCAATTLAWNDRLTSGKLHPLTRKALDRACSLQREDGSWDWLKCGWPPAESDDHYGVTFAALGIGAAPDGYAESAAGKKCLEGIRRYLKAKPAPSPHHRGMVLWASLHVEGLLSNEERRRTVDELLGLQRPDGGWPTAALFEGWKEHRRLDGKPQDLENGDGYATGFILYLARRAGVPADDPRLERGLEWLGSRQRESGRWFTPSPTQDSRHYITNLGTAFAILALEACGKVARAGAVRAEDWPAWRGPTGRGVSSETGLPVRFSAKEGVRWKAALPEAGNSTPIVWGGQVFLTQATGKGSKRSLLSFDRADGRLQWERTVEHREAEPTHADNPFCSASPATDGKRVVVSHGSAGVFSYGLDGSELWRRDLGKLHHIWGNASSPVIEGDLCFLNCGPGERTFLIALKLATGETAWKLDIPGGSEGGDPKTWTGSWSTPLLFRRGGESELVMSFPHRLRGYDPRSGRELWSCEGLGRLVYSSPVAGEGAIVAFSGFMGPSLAVRAGGRGDITATHRLWRSEKAPQRIGSGIITGGHLYLVNDNGVAECLELESGRTVWRERLGGQTWGSPVLAEGKLYVVEESGDCSVIRAAPVFERIARSSLGETTRASPAVSGGQLFIRTFSHLWCIGDPR